MSDEVEPRPDFWMRPVLSVANVRESIDYYCNKLGFSLAWSSGDESKLWIAEVQRPGVELILQNGTSVQSSSVPSVLALELHTHLSLQRLHDELVARGALVRKAPFAVEWQADVYQMEVEDLDGNVLLFWGDLPAPG